MAFISTAIIIFTFFSFFIGQIFRFNFFGISFPLIDIAIVLLFLLNFFIRLKSKNLRFENKFLVYFLSFIWFCFVFNYLKYQINSFKPLFYLIRLSCLLSFLIYPPKIKTKEKQIFLLIVFANIIFGFIQYFFWPNFTYFNILNWDPHLYRLVSTFFDPTFTGLIYLFFIVNVFLNPKIPFRIPILFFSYLGMILTYSRSTYLSFLLTFLFISLKLKKIKIFLISFLLIFVSIICLPRLPGEGTKLERTSSIKAKIENYQEGISLFKKSPLIGLGYNNLSFFRINQKYNSHAISGFDSSLLTLLISTGIIGTVLFLLGIRLFFLKANLTKQSMLIAVIFHSFFANSLLFPWILLSLILF